MAWIQPNTDIRLMRGVPLSPSQENTIWFDSLNNQAVYFSRFSGHNFTAQTYQRVNNNVCRLEINAETIYDCNYMSFKNTAFGNKTFYAFITNVEYINHNVSEITYVIDDIQTWFFEMRLGQCYVEREHSASDLIYEHLQPEPIDVGENVCEEMVGMGFNELSIVLNVPFDDT